MLDNRSDQQPDGGLGADGQPTTSHRSAADSWQAERASLLRGQANRLARVALANIAREYPHHELHRQNGEPVPRPRQLHPAFYGSYDWHSCVEMYWVLVRLSRTVPHDVPQTDIRRTLQTHLTAPALAAETSYFARDDQRTNQRPYGWSALLELANEIERWDHPDAHAWNNALAPLTETFVARYLDWLPRATYPVRHGVHTNGAFGLSRAFPFAQQRALRGDPALLDAILDATRRWFSDDSHYPAEWEPSGADFLSPALAEADLMSRVLSGSEFDAWLSGFLPGIRDARPAILFRPVEVSDPSDGQIAHLHGLNLHRAWCWTRLAAQIPSADQRHQQMLSAARSHAAASLSQATGSGYAVEHYLAYYATLLLAHDYR